MVWCRICRSFRRRSRARWVSRWCGIQLAEFGNLPLIGVFAGVFGRVWKDKRRLTGPDQLKLLADFHLLLAGAFFQTADMFPAALILEDHGGIPFLKRADQAMFLEQFRNALGSAQGHPS